MARPKLLIATRNPGKIREYQQLLQEIPFELVSLDDIGVSQEVEETGLTFAENASLKAHSYSALGGLLALADDSGLEVDALGGEPGVHSARYGENSLQPPNQEGPRVMSDQDRVKLLLHNLEAVPWARRTARFRCVIAVTSPPTPPFVKGARGDFLQSREQPGDEQHQVADSDVALMVGSVAGMIQYEPMGDEGFGYDPVFYLPSYGLTMAQLPLEEKNRISHRANAAGKAVQALSTLSIIHHRAHTDH